MIVNAEHQDPSRSRTSTTEELYSLQARTISSCLSMGFKFLWIDALAVSLARYSRCLHDFYPGWTAMRCCNVSIWPGWLFDMEQCLNIIWRTVRWCKEHKWSCIRISNALFVSLPGVTEGSTFGNLNDSFFSLSVSGHCFTMQWTSCAVSVPLTIHVGSISARHNDLIG